MDLEEWLIGLGMLAIFSYITAQLGIEILQEVVNWIFKPRNWKIKIFSISMLLAILVIFRKRAKQFMPPEAVKVERKLKTFLKQSIRMIWSKIKSKN
jgi:hypothetical protein